MKILHSTGMQCPTKFGSYEHWLVELAKQVKMQGHTLAISYTKSIEEVEGYTKALKENAAQLVMLDTDEAIMHFCKENKIDIVHFHFDLFAHSGLYFSLWRQGIKLYGSLHCECGYLLDNMWKKSVISFVRIWGHRLKTYARSYFFHKYFACADAIKTQYEQFYFWKKKKVQCLYLGIPHLDNLIQQKDGEKKALTITCIAFHSPIKGIDVLLRALRILKDRGKSFLLYQIGGGSTELKGEDSKNLFILCKQLGLEKNVKWVGITNNVVEYLNKTDIYCQPSRTEAICLSIAEAMEMGLPVVATRVGGVSELVRDGETGFLVERESPQELANKLELLMQDKQRRETMGRNAKKHLQDICFYQEESVERLLLIYNSSY